MQMVFTTEELDLQILKESTFGQQVSINQSSRFSKVPDIRIFGLKKLYPKKKDMICFSELIR